ncbi:MAG TPA: BTAD domain-containing putative transcriptional regulator, partial [Micromonosporaceae bacterium]
MGVAVAGVQVRVLGPLEVIRAGSPASIGGVKPRQLLATLALHHGRAVSTDHLVQVLWPDRRPRSAVANLQTYVSTLRPLFGAERLRRQPAGYRLDLTRSELDLAQFEAWLGDGELAALDRAVQLWRGEPAEGLPVSAQWAGPIERLRQQFRAARTTRARLRIDAGATDAAIADLRLLLADDPLCEETWRLLIVALRDSGQRSDALAAYAQARRVLAAELGIEPGEPLRRLHRGLLLHDVPGPAPRLGADAAVLLRALSELDLGPVPEWVASAVLDGADATGLLADLTAARLLHRVATDQAGQQRYALPALIGLLAPDLPDPNQSDDRAGLADRDDARPSQLDPLSRVLAGYLWLAEATATGLPRHVFGPATAPAPRWPVPERGRFAGDRGDPLAWFAAERGSLVAAVAAATRLGRADLAWELVHALTPWFDLGGHTAEWAATHETALAACRADGDLLGQAVTLRGLGQLHLYQDRYDDAAASFSRSRLLFARVGDQCGLAGALAGLGTVHRVQGGLRHAMACYRESLRIYVDLDHRHGEAYARSVIGKVLLARGRVAPAKQWFGRALAIAEEVGDLHRAALVTHQLGVLAQRAGSVHEAKAAMRAALARFVALRDTRCQAYCLSDLAGLEPPDAAVERLTGALDTFERFGDLRAQAVTSRRLGDL